MESKAGKKKRSSSSSSSSSDRTSHCPALPAVIADLRPWGSVKWKDPALGDVRACSLSISPRTVRKVDGRHQAAAADGAGLCCAQLMKCILLAVRQEAILTGHGRPSSLQSPTACRRRLLID